MIQSPRFYNWLRVFLAAFLLASSVPSAITVHRLAAAHQPAFGHTVTSNGLHHRHSQIAKSFSRTADLERGDLRPSVSVRSRHVSWHPVTEGEASRVSANFPVLSNISLDSTAPLPASPLVSGCGPRAPPSVIPIA